MESNQSNNPAVLKQYPHCKDTNKQKLIRYVESVSYIDESDQASVCKQFGLPFLRGVFREIYRRRFYEFLCEKTTTVADVTAKTGIPQKYLTVCKQYYEKKKLLLVVGLGICPNTGSTNVQFVSTNPELLTGQKSAIINQQLPLF